MGTRLELQSKLEELLGFKHVYYQPPKTVKMEYPAIVYFRNNIKITHADNTVYLKKSRYDLTVISKKPEDPVLDKLLDLPYCSPDRQYKSDNLYHDTFTLYF